MEQTFGEAIYDPAFELGGAHLVAASAGTGKTYNIQNIYLRLIVERGLPVEQIQVMTFTEAATKELRDRLRKILLAYEALLEGRGETLKPAEVERLTKLRACARARLGAVDPAHADAIVLRRVALALMTFDQAAISTIHGFCRRILTRFAFETGSAFAATLEDDGGAQLQQRVRDWWRAATAKGEVPFTLAQLQQTVEALAGKADWVLGPGEEARALLEQAQAIVAADHAARPAREKQSFNDLLCGVREALARGARGEALAEALRGEFKAALIDEFQDTDPVQYDIFRRVFLDPAASEKPVLFFVGDPKQAIYSFRGGDIYTYRQAVMQPEVAAQSYRLDCNFRSTPRLVAAVNSLFQDRRGADGRWQRTFGDETIAYETPLRAGAEVAPLTEADGRPDATPFRICWCDAKRSPLSSQTAARVVEVLVQHVGEIGPGDVAVLVPSHNEAEKVCAALERFGVQAVLQQAGNVFDGEVAWGFYPVLKAMAGMDGVEQVRAALASGFFAFSPEELSPQQESPLLAEMLECFGRVCALWRTHGFQRACETLMAHPRCDIRRRLAAGAGGERALADLLQIVDLAGAATAQLGPAPERLVAWYLERLNRAAQLEARSETYARRMASDRAAVRIMTLHASKGLEFPVAIVQLSAGARERAPYFFHRRLPDGQVRLEVDCSEAARAAAEAERQAERLRLLYVAFTRATRRTVVVADREHALLRALARNSVDASPEGEVSAVLACDEMLPEAPNLPAAFGREAAGARLAPAREPRHFAEAPTRGSYSSLSPGAHGELEDGHDFDHARAEGEAEESDHPILAVKGGAKVGTCWHEILEHIAFDLPRSAIERAALSSLKLHGLAGERAPEEAAMVAEMMEKVLDWPLTAPDGERFSLRDVAWADRISEWAFDFSSAASAQSTAAIAQLLRQAWRADPAKAPFLEAMEGWERPIPRGYLKGFVDLLFRHNGFYYIVDWKSNSLNRHRSDFDARGICAEMASAGYFFQYLLYAAVLHRYLKETMGAEYSWARHFGGIRYYFLRGIAAQAPAPVFADRPSEALLDGLLRLLGLEGAQDD